MARAAIQIIDSKDPLQIKTIIQSGLSLAFKSIMSTSEENLSDFTEILSSRPHNGKNDGKYFL